MQLRGVSESGHGQLQTNLTLLDEANPYNEMMTITALHNQYEDALTRALLTLRPQDADTTDRVALLPEDLQTLLSHYSLPQLARLAHRLHTAGRADHIRRLCRILAETQLQTSSGFCVHLLGFLCQSSSGAGAFKAHERALWLSSGDFKQMLLARLCDRSDGAVLKSVPLAEIFDHLHHSLKPPEEASSEQYSQAMMVYFHLLAGALSSLETDQGLTSRLRVMPLAHTLLSLIYQHEEHWTVSVAGFAELCRDFKAYPFLEKNYRALSPLLEEQLSLQALQKKVRRAWEKSERKSENTETLVQNWLQKMQNDLALRQGNLSAWISLEGEWQQNRVTYLPLEALQTKSDSLPAYLFSYNTAQWGPDQRRLPLPESETTARLAKVYLDWQTVLFSRFLLRDWFQPGRFASLFLEDGEVTWLFLVWSLWLRGQGEADIAKVLHQIAPHLPEPEVRMALAELFSELHSETLLRFCGLPAHPNSPPTARFRALSDFILREIYFKDRAGKALKTNSLVPETLKKLLRESQVLLATDSEAVSAFALLGRLLETIQTALQQAPLRQHLQHLQERGFFELILCEALIRRQDPQPRISFLHALINRPDAADRGRSPFPVVLLSGHLLSDPQTALWPFVARRCASVLWPAVNRLSFALTDSLLMEYIQVKREQDLLQAQEKRQREYYGRISLQLNQVFEQERHLNSLLEGVRQSILPAAMALFSIGNWTIFSKIFNDHEELTLKDGTRFRGYHSSLNLRLDKFKLSLQWLQENQPLDQPSGFLAAFYRAWQTSDQTETTAQALMALLKLLCYDSLDPHKQVYWSQILAALRGPGQAPEFPGHRWDALRWQIVREQGDHPSDLSPFMHPDDGYFLRWLATEIAPNLSVLREPAASSRRFLLQPEVSPAQFLQSLAWLVHHALRPLSGSADKVALVQVNVRFREDPHQAHQLQICLACEGLFQDVNSLLSDARQLYHSTAEHFRVLLRALNPESQKHVIPVVDLKTASMISAYFENPHLPFLLLECKPENKTWILLSLTGESRPQALPRRQYEDLEA